DLAVLDAGRDGLAKQRDDLLGRRVGGHVPVAAGLAEQRVTDRAANDHAVIARAIEGLEHGHDRRGDRYGEEALARLLLVIRGWQSFGAQGSERIQKAGAAEQADVIGDLEAEARTRGVDRIELAVGIIEA